LSDLDEGWSKITLGSVGFFHVAPLALRDGLRRKEGNLFCMSRELRF